MDLIVPQELLLPIECHVLLCSVQPAIGAVRKQLVGVEVDNYGSFAETDLETNESAGMPAPFGLLVIEGANDQELIVGAYLYHVLLNEVMEMGSYSIADVSDDSLIVLEAVLLPIIDNEVVEQLQRVAINNLLVGDLVLSLLLPLHRESMHLLSSSEEGTTIDFIDAVENAVIDGERHLH
jgi:hypothetical protein